ncbi:MAG: DNA polymerase III subunit delta [Planctomycetaceae bacterium]
MLATAFLKAPEKHPVPPVVALYGKEGFLKQAALQAIKAQVLGDDAELGLTRLPGETVELKTVVDLLLTVSMWSPRQVVVVDLADAFVSKYREGLERYADRPAKKSVLVLDVQSWPANTKLAKKVATSGMALECPLFDHKKIAELTAWLIEHTQAAHAKKLNRDAAQLLVELAGFDLGLLAQELAKLATFVGDARAIDAQAVERLVGGWKAETTWKMLDSVRDGRIDVAIDLLDKLLGAGEHPLRLLGGINASYRPIARGVETARRGAPLRQALADEGVKPFTLDAVEAYLRRLTRAKAERILDWLLEADLDVKGASALPERLILERLLLRLRGSVA